MKGEASRATSAMSPIAARQPGSSLAARIPSATRRKKPGAPSDRHGWRNPDHREGDHDRREGRRVDAEDDRVVVGEQREPGQRRAHHPAEVELCRGQRDRAEQVFLLHQVRDHRLVGGKPDCARRPAEESERHEGGRRVVADRSEHGEDGGEEHLRQSGEDQPSPAVEAVGEDATERREEADGDERGCGDEPCPCGAPGPGEHQDAEGDRLHPRAHVRDEGGGPDECEVPRVERPQRGESHRSRLPGTAPAPTSLPVELDLPARPQREPPDAHDGGEDAKGGGGLRDLV